MDDKVSIFRLPIFWMFIGPPAIRLGVERSAMASVEGNADIWNIIRVIWWTLWGGVALYELIRQRDWVAEFTSRISPLTLWAGGWIGMMFVSTSQSPSVLFTLATAGMFLMLTLAAADLGVKVFRGLISVHRILRMLFFLSIGLSALVYIIYLVDPTSSVVVGETYTGITRIRGRGVAYTPNLAQVIFLISLYFWIQSDRKWHILLLGTMALGLYFLYLGQTRSAYGSFGVTIGLFVWNRFNLRHNYKRLVPLAACGVAVLAGVIYLYGFSHRVTWRVDQFYKTFVLRDQFAIKSEELAMQSFSTLNGRTQAAAVVMDAAVQQPLGLGYIAGLRTYMAQPHIIDKLGTDSFHGAHNSYLEVLAGTGYIGFFSYLALIFTVIWRARKLEGIGPLTLRLLLYLALLQGFFESNLGFAFRQMPVQFLLTSAALAALYARTHEPEPTRKPSYAA